MTNFFTRQLRVKAAATFLTVSSTAALVTGSVGPSFNGAAYTTDQAGARVNQNIYESGQEVYLNGGPNNNQSNGLPANEVFYFEVTDPSGKILLSSDPANCRQVITNSSGRVMGPYFGDGCGHAAGSVDSSNGSIAVQLWPFDQTPNNGNEYKVVLVRKDAPGVSVEEDGRHLDYPRAAAKSDNFKVRTNSTITPTPTPTPSPTPTNPGGDT